MKQVSILMLLLIFSLPQNLIQAKKRFKLDNKIKPIVFLVGDAKTQIIKIINENPIFSDYGDFVRQNLIKFEGVTYGTGATGADVGQTVVCTSKLNCVTFIETFWALTETCFQISSKNNLSDEDKFNIFIENLNLIRFYDGNNCDLEDRINYFTDALWQLQQKNRLFNVALINGEPMKKKIHYVSSNKKIYSTMNNWKRLGLIEQDMSNRILFWYPLKEIDRYQSVAKDGDIVALASDVPGLDVSHCGYITVKNQELMFSHASSVKKKVVIEQDFCNYLASRTSITGIYVYRPIY